MAREVPIRPCPWIDWVPTGCENHGVTAVPPIAMAGFAGVVNDNSAAYDLVLLAHVLSALIGMVAVVAAGGFALTLRRALQRGGPLPETVVRYYRPGTNWVGRVLFAVPAFGIALVAMSGGQWKWSDTWVTMGMGVWLVVAGLAEAVLWPGERRLQEVVTTGTAVVGADGTSGSSVDRSEAPCLVVAGVAAACAAAFVAVAVLMVAKP